MNAATIAAKSATFKPTTVHRQLGSFIPPTIAAPLCSGPWRLYGSGQTKLLLSRKFWVHRQH
jgi:hypothetical protein